MTAWQSTFRRQCAPCGEKSVRGGEAIDTCEIAGPHDLAHHPDSVGRPFGGNTVIVIDAAGRPAPARTIGRIAIASYMNMDRYIDDESHSLLLGEERFLITSDIGWLDTEGRLYLCNRAITGGDEDLPIYKLESDLRELPCITDAAVVTNGRGVRAIQVVVAVPDQRNASSDRLRDRIHGLVAAERLQLAQVSILNKLPYSPTGKLRLSAFGRA